MQRTANDTDEQLVARAQSGDKQAEEELLLRYRNLVRYCARKFFLVGGETEDLIQEGMMGLFQAVSAFKRKQEGDLRFKNFAYLCIFRRIVDAVKIAAKKQPVSVVVFEEHLDGVGENIDPDEGLIFVDEQKEFRQKMSGVLSDFEFKIFTMYMDGMSCAEICQTTGKSVKSVDNAIQRSKRKLQKVFKPIV